MSEVKSMKYFIVGYMASGKSTFGKELAKDKGLPFLDLDESVESREGRSISEIFAKRERSISGRGNGRSCMRYVTRRMNLCWPREGEHLVSLIIWTI